MSALDNDTCDEVTLRLSGLIGIFDMMVSLTVEENCGKNATMSDFAYFISTELQSIFKKISGVDYRD